MKPKILLLAVDTPLPYQVLCCAAHAASAVYIIGTAPAKGLEISRYCKEYFLYDGILNECQAVSLVQAINNLAEKLAIDYVIPSCIHTTRFLARNKQALKARCFPVPEPHTLDVLDNKSSFIVSNGEG